MCISLTLSLIMITVFNWKMDRWHCLYYCTAGSSTSLMEIQTYDPRSMEPLLYNLSYPVMSYGPILTGSSFFIYWTMYRNASSRVLQFFWYTHVTDMQKMPHVRGTSLHNNVIPSQLAEQQPPAMPTLVPISIPKWYMSFSIQMWSHCVM